MHAYRWNLRKNRDMTCNWRRQSQWLIINIQIYKKIRWTMTIRVTINVWSSVSWLIGTVQVESNSSTHTVQEWWLLSEILSKEMTNKRYSDTAQKMSFFLIKTKHEESVKMMLHIKRGMRTTIVSSSTTHVENHRKFFFPMMITITIFYQVCVWRSQYFQKRVGKIPDERQMSGRWSSMDENWKGQYRH